MRIIDRAKLLQLVNECNWEEIPRETLVYWMCIWGRDVEVAPAAEHKEEK